MNSAIQDARAATSRLVRLLGGTPESPPPARPLLENAKRDAKTNDTAWDEKLKKELIDYYAYVKHDRAYWHEVLDGKISPETFEQLMQSIGLP